MIGILRAQRVYDSYFQIGSILDSFEVLDHFHFLDPFLDIYLFNNLHISDGRKTKTVLSKIFSKRSQFVIIF